jgi:hypothetical protein
MGCVHQHVDATLVRLPHRLQQLCAGSTRLTGERRQVGELPVLDPLTPALGRLLAFPGPSHLSRPMQPPLVSRP